MNSSKSSRKRQSKGSSEEIKGFDLLYQLSYMSSTASAGISRARIFELARQVDAPTSTYFETINHLMGNMRYNSPDACRMVGERVKSGDVRTFLFRLADALRSGEPLAPFLAREAEVQAIHYSNEYERDIESMQKWTDGYISVTISAALIVIINMVSTMIYDVGIAMMASMVFTAIVIAFVVAWVLSRAAPREVLSVPWVRGSKEQRRGLKLLKILLPVASLAAIVLVVLGLDLGWILIIPSIILLPLGFVCQRAEGEVGKKDGEVSAFFRSIGGTATSRGTTLGRALDEMELDAFPTLRKDIRILTLRLRAGAKPGICWERFGVETGSLLIQQSADTFYQSTNLGGDPETAGVLCSKFSSAVSLLRAKRRGVAATFSWLTIAMHCVISALMVFILEILGQFINLMNSVMSGIGQEASTQQAGTALMSFATPQVAFLEKMAIALVVMLGLTNAFGIVGSEGTSIIKISFYLPIMYILSGVCFLVIPSVVTGLL